MVCSVSLVPLVDGTVLSHNNRNPLRRKLLKLGKFSNKLVSHLFRPLRVGCILGKTEQPVIIVNRQEQSVLNRILRQSEIVLRRVRDVGVSSRHGQPSVCVVGARSPDCVHEYLVELHDPVHIELDIVSRSRNLVHGLEYEVLVVVLKSLCNLLPHSLILLLHGVKVVRSYSKPSRLFRAVVVNVDNDIHILLNTIIHDVLYTAQPLIINCISVFIINHSSPCYGNSHSVKAIVMHCLYNLLRCLNMLP